MFEKGKHKKLSNKSFHEVGFLGKGAFGIVKKIKSRKTGKIYALKLLQLNDLVEEKMTDQFMKEGNLNPFISLDKQFGYKAKSTSYLTFSGNFDDMSPSEYSPLICSF
jgi:serine/threonine protein kinase